jgi:hypothetical protein
MTARNAAQVVWRIDIAPASVTKRHVRASHWTVMRVDDRAGARGEPRPEMTSRSKRCCPRPRECRRARSTTFRK